MFVSKPDPIKSGVGRGGKITMFSVAYCVYICIVTGSWGKRIRDYVFMATGYTDRHYRWWDGTGNEALTVQWLQEEWDSLYLWYSISFLGPQADYRLLFCFYQSYFVCRHSFVKFLNFRHLLWKFWANFDKTWYAWPLGQGFLKLFKLGGLSLLGAPQGDQNGF